MKKMHRVKITNDGGKIMNESMKMGKEGKVLKGLKWMMGEVKKWMDQVKEKVEHKLWLGRNVLAESRGIGTIEIVLILVVLIALIVIFRDQLLALISAIFERITSESEGI